MACICSATFRVYWSNAPDEYSNPPHPSPSSCNLDLLCVLLSGAVQDNSSEALAKTKTDYETFLADASTLKQVREHLKVRDDVATRAVSRELRWICPQLVCAYVVIIFLLLAQDNPESVSPPRQYNSLRCGA